MKKLYWIDDSFGAIESIMRSAFPELWEVEKDEGISSHILIIGNEYMHNSQDYLYGDNEEKECIEKVKSYFEEICADFDQTDEEKKTFSSHRKLVENPVRMVFKSTDDEEKHKIYKELLTWAKATEEYPKDKLSSLMENVIKILSIESPAVVGIDILIWKGDMEKIENKRMVFSLAVFHELKQKGYTCFLYSSNADDIDLVRNCKEIYTEQFKGEELEAIFLRADLMRKGNVDVISKIKDMF